MRISRRIFGLFAGVSLPALAAGAARADIAFTVFAFPATGSPTSRTEPDRFAEVKNVLDFGADPSGVSFSTAAIQAAVNAVMSAGGGTVFFPINASGVGAYRVDDTITFNLDAVFGIRFLGTPGASVNANMAKFIFDRHLGSPNNTGGMRGFESLLIQNGNAAGGAVRMGSTDGGYVRDCSLSGFVCFTSEDSAGNSSQNILFENIKFSGNVQTGGIGLVMGGSGAMFDCDFIGNDFGFVGYGNGFFGAGNRIENCNTAYQLGLDSSGTNRGVSGFTFSGSAEGNLTFVHMAGTCVGGTIGPMGLLGHSTSGPGQNTPSAYGLRIEADCAQACVFYNIVPNSFFSTAGISIANATSRANNVFVSCDSSVTGGGSNWVLPTNAYTAKFFQCNVQPIWTFSQLPTGGNLLEGDEFNISDATTATWGDNVTTGGGSNHVAVRYNGANLTVFGK